MQLGCAPGSTLTSIIMVPALPGILMVTSVMISDLSSGSVSVYSPSVGLLLALVLWDILLWTAKQENLLYVPSSSGPDRTIFDDTLPCFSLSTTRCSCYFWWDRVFHRHCIRFLLRWLLWGLLLLVLTVATSFALASVAPCGTMSVRLWLLASVRALCHLGCNLGMTNSFKMIDAFASITGLPICGAVPSLMRFATFATMLAIITAATGPSFRQCVSR